MIAFGKDDPLDNESNPVMIKLENEWMMLSDELVIGEADIMMSDGCEQTHVLLRLNSTKGDKTETLVFPIETAEIAQMLMNKLKEQCEEAWPEWEFE